MAQDKSNISIKNWRGHNKGKSFTTTQYFVYCGGDSILKTSRSMHGWKFHIYCSLSFYYIGKPQFCLHSPPPFVQKSLHLSIFHEKNGRSIEQSNFVCSVCRTWSELGLSGLDRRGGGLGGAVRFMHKHVLTFDDTCEDGMQVKRYKGDIRIYKRYTNIEGGKIFIRGQKIERGKSLGGQKMGDAKNRGRKNWGTQK